MSYTPTEWKAGDTVTSAKLNKIEQGVAGAGSGVLVVHQTENQWGDVFFLDKTWKEIHDADFAVLKITQQSGDDSETAVYSIAFTYAEDGEYAVEFRLGENTKIFLTTSENGYPERENK